MALTPITEFLNGGIVTARHPALLVPGELQRADNCVYREKDPSIQRAPGRTLYNSVALSAGLKGLSYLSFDQETDQIVAFPAGNGTNSYLYKSDFTAVTGTFSIMTGPGQVLNCTISGTTTVTAAAGSFTDMFVGVHVYGTGVVAGTTVSGLTSDTVITISTPATNGSGITLSFDAGIKYGFPDLGTEVLDTIQWENSYFALTKTGKVSRIQWRSFPLTSTQQLVVRQAGLTPITQTPTTTVQSGAGWSSVLGNGYYWFLVTELISYDGGQTIEAEAGYTANGGRPVSANITAYASQYITITFPTIKNDGAEGNRATHWGVYMSVISPGKAAYADNTNVPSPATFRRIMVVDISETTKDIKYTNATLGPTLPTTSAAVGGYGEFTTPAGAFTRGGGSANTTTTLAKADVYAGFGLTLASGTITGIKVNVVARSAALQLCPFEVWLDNNSTRISNHLQGIAAFDTYRTYGLGDQFNNWGAAWVFGDVANLRVTIAKTPTSGTRSLYIDYIELIVYYSGVTIDTGSVNLDGVPYQVVTYRSQIGTTVSDPANFIIPTASTGDIFGGSLVLNNVNNAAEIRYSIPGLPESFPSPYVLKFQSKKKDLVNYIRKVGTVLVVGMRDSIKRVNYLPTEVDVDFTQGIAHEDITTDHGIVGPRAGALVDLKGIGVVLAYVSYNGFYYTDGIMSRPLNLDIRISDLVKASALSNCILKVYPKEKWLVFYYCPIGVSHSSNTRALVFHYSPDKIRDNGFLPITGPITISARSSTEATLSGVPYLLTGHETNGGVYVEDNGTTQATNYQVYDSTGVAANAPICPLIRTRKMFAAGYARDTRVKNVYLLYDTVGTILTISTTTTIMSLTVTSAAAFGSVVVGMTVKGTGIPPETTVTAKATSSSLTLSNPALVSGTSNLTFDDGTVSIKLRGSGIGDAVVDFNCIYTTTATGDLLVTDHDNTRPGLELQIEKVYMPDTSTVDLNQALRIHNFTYMVEDEGKEMNRAT